MRRVTGVGGILVLVWLAAGCSGGSAVRDRLVLLPHPPDRLLGEQLIEARYVVAGTLVKLEDADAYEPRAGWLMRALLSEERPPEAYEATIAVDSVLKGSGRPKRLYVMFFAPQGNLIPTPGTNAIWFAHRRQLWRLAQSTYYGTPYDVGLAFDSDDDIRPLGEWPRLRDIARRLEPPQEP